jgi:hypothetical protein
VKLKESAVWLYDPAANAWTNMRPPPYRSPEKYSREVVGGLCSGAVYDPADELVLSFGGQGAGGSKNALFAYDAHANALHLLRAEGAPPERDGMGIAWDARRGRLVVFGSQYLEDGRTWTFDLRANRWQAHELEPHPPAGKVTRDYTTIPRLAYDSLHDAVLCIAWLGEQAHETWVLETGALETGALGPGELRWRKMEPAVEPDGSKSRSRNLSFDAGRNVFILETSSARTNRPEIWTYRLSEVAPPARPAPPAALELVTHAGGKASLTWEPSVTPGVKEYRVHRARAVEPWKAEFAPAGATAGNRFDDEGLEPGAVYLYRVAAVGGSGEEGPPGLLARTRPRVPAAPVVSVLARDRVEVAWGRHAAGDVTGYNLYRGVASVRTVKEGSPGPWRDNDPAYAEPQVVEVLDITDLRKLNARPLAETAFTDEVDLERKGSGAGDYRFAVHAYIVRAVNRLGVESGPSPHALTIPSEPRAVLCREQGETAELRWDASPEKGLRGYHVYKLEGTWVIQRVTPEPLRETTFRHHAGAGPTRYWIVAVDALGQEGQPSSPAWFGHAHRGFFQGEWHQ